MEQNKYEYTTFGQLFNSISFDYESKYEPDIWTEEGITRVTFYKTTIRSDGLIERKGNYSTFDPKLFWKVEFMAKLLMNDSTMEVLYGQK